MGDPAKSQVRIKGRRARIGDGYPQPADPRVCLPLHQGRHEGGTHGIISGEQAGEEVGDWSLAVRHGVPEHPLLPLGK